MTIRRRILLVAFLVLLLGSTPSIWGDELQIAQSALDSGDPTTALEVVSRYLKKNPSSAEAWLIQSTVHFMLGQVEVGTEELEKVLKLDPQLRQGWLNRAGLAIASEDLQTALDSFLKARELDPSAADNDLNLGATRLLLGELDLAAEHFESYLSTSPGQAKAFYLVATNYAMGGYAAFALRHLHQAILYDERVRRQARRDPNFLLLEGHPRFLDLMSTDIFVLPSGSHRTARAFSGSYDGGQGPLLQSVLDALHGLHESIDPNVEVTPDWALIWGRYRIKLRQDTEGGVVELSAPVDRFSPHEWERATKVLLDSIFIQLQKRQ